MYWMLSPISTNTSFQPCLMAPKTASKTPTRESPKIAKDSKIPEKRVDVEKKKSSNWKYLGLVAVLGLLIGLKYKEIVPMLEKLLENVGSSDPAPLKQPEGFGAGKILAVGDLHGDYENAIKTMKMAGVVDAKGNWIAGESTFVQTGDVVDRGDDTIALYKMMMKLRTQAAQAGGRVVPLLGNHEVLNMAEVYNWVTPGDIKSFGGEENRKKAWEAQGWIGKYLRELGIAANVNGTVFFHGGASPKWAIKNVDGLNLESTKSLGLTPLQIQTAPIFGDDGPIWYRGFAQDPEWKICRVLQETLDLFGAKRVNFN